MGSFLSFKGFCPLPQKGSQEVLPPSQGSFFPLQSGINPQGSFSLDQNSQFLATSQSNPPATIPSDSSRPSQSINLPEDEDGEDNEDYNEDGEVYEEKEEVDSHDIAQHQTPYVNQGSQAITPEALQIQNLQNLLTFQQLQTQLLQAKNQNLQDQLSKPVSIVDPVTGNVMLVSSPVNNLQPGSVPANSITNTNVAGRGVSHLATDSDPSARSQTQVEEGFAPASDQIEDENEEWDTEDYFSEGDSSSWVWPFMAHNYKIRPPRVYSELLRVVVSQNPEFTQDYSQEEEVIDNPYSILHGASSSIKTASSPKIPMEKAFAEVVAGDAQRLLDSKKSSLSLSESSLKAAFPASQSLEDSLFRVTPLGEPEVGFIRNHGGFKEASQSKPYKSRRFADAEKLSVRNESSFASIGRLANTLTHVQGVLAAWCDPARQQENNAPPSKQAVTDMFNLANYLSAHIARLTFKAKGEVVLDRRRRFFDAMRLDSLAVQHQNKETKDQRIIIPPSAEDSLTFLVPLHGEDLFAGMWQKHISDASAQQRSVVDAVAVAKATEAKFPWLAAPWTLQGAQYVQTPSTSVRRGRGQSRRGGGRGRGRGNQSFRGRGGRGRGSNYQGTKPGRGRASS